MDDSIGRALEQWTVFYGLIGGIAGTLLGLLFVALSLRLAIFHQRQVADVRAFATFTFGTFLVTILMAVLAVAPHERGGVLAVVLLLAGAVGLLLTGWVARDWMRHCRGVPGIAWRVPSHHRPAVTVTGCLGLLYLGLLAAAVLVWRGHPQALGWVGGRRSGPPGDRRRLSLDPPRPRTGRLGPEPDWRKLTCLIGTPARGVGRRSRVLVATRSGCDRCRRGRRMQTISRHR